jgi:hypothetical protein
LDPNWFAPRTDFDHFLYPTEFHQAVRMVISELAIDTRRSQSWLHAQALTMGRDILLMTADIVACRLRITPAGLVDATNSR